MLLRYFKSGLPSRFLFLLLIFFIIRLPGLLHAPTPVAFPNNTFLPWFYSFIPQSQTVHWIISFLLLFFAGYVINFFGTNIGLTGKSSSLTLLFFVLLCSLLPFSDPLNPYLFATLFLVWYFGLLFRIPDATFPIRFAFDAGFALGMAALFFPVLIYMVAFTWIALMIYQTAQWRNYVTTLLGAVTPYLIIGFIAFMLNKPVRVISLLIPRFDNLFTFEHWHIVQLGMIFLFSVFILYTSLQVLSIVRTKSIEVRQHTSIVFWALIFIFSIIVLFRSPPEAFVSLGIPASWLLASFFDNVKKEKHAGWFVNSLIVLIILFQTYFLYAA